MRSGVTGTLRLGAVPTASTTASLVLSAFCSDHPLVKVHIHSRLATTELCRRLRDFELEAAIVHAVPDEARDVELMPLYEERYVLIAPSDMLPAATSTVRWPDAAQLPLALLTQDMRGDPQPHSDWTTKRVPSRIPGGGAALAQPLRTTLLGID